MRMLKQSTAANVMVFVAQSADHITGLTGATLTITASKDGAAFGSISPTVTERGSGWYNLALTTSHTDTLGDLAFHITATSADPVDFVSRVVAVNHADANAFGLAYLDAAVTSRASATDYTSGRAAALDNLDAAVSTRSTYNGGAVASVTGAVGSVTAAVTVSDKTGYKLASDGLDSISTTAPSGVAANFREMMVALWRYRFKKVVKDKNTLTFKTYADDGSTVVTTQAYTDDGAGNESQGAAS